MENTNTQTTNNTDKVAISLATNENVNLTGTVSAIVNGNSIQVMYLSCNLNADTFALNINMTVSNKELYLAHSNEVRSKYAEFRAMVEKRATDLGYIVF